MRQIQYVLICGASGTGKTTLIDALIVLSPKLRRLPAYTTRSRRRYERDGREYYFVSKRKFQTMISKGCIKPEDVGGFNGHLFAFSHQVAVETVNEGKVVLAEVFHEQIRVWRKKYGASLFVIALLPNDISLLYQRLKQRGHRRRFIEERINQARKEISAVLTSKLADFYLYVDSHTEIDQAAKRIVERMLY